MSFRLATVGCALGAIWSLRVLEDEPIVWLEWLLGTVGLAAGWSVAYRGLLPLLGSLHPSRETAHALVICVAYLLSSLLAILDILGRPASRFLLPAGQTALFFDAALLAVGASLIRRSWLPPRSGASRSQPAAAARPGARLLVALLLAAALMPAALWALLAGSLPLAVTASLSLLLGADLFLLDNTRRSLLAQWCDHLASGGIRVRRPAAVERLREAGSLLCERRGILTRGEPEITDAIPLAEDRTADDVLQLAAVAEFAARHPFSRAVLSRRTLEAGTIPRVKGFEQIPGQGVRAFLRGRELLCGNIRLLREHGFAEDVIKELSEVARPFRQRGESVIFVALGGVVQGLVALMDPLRPEAVELAHSLRRRGKRLRVLTGGDADAVEAATRELGETDVLRDLSPQERGRAVGDLVLQGLCVAVVGTREKNAPALQAASISIEWPASLQDDPAGGAGGPLGADIALAEPRLEQISSLLDASDEYHGRVRRFGRSLAAVVLPALAVAGGALYPWLGLPPSPLLAAAVCLTAHLASLRVRR